MGLHAQARRIDAQHLDRLPGFGRAEAGDGSQDGWRRAHPDFESQGDGGEVGARHSGLSVIPSAVEGSRCATFKVTPRDPSTPLRFAQDDSAGTNASSFAGPPAADFANRIRLPEKSALNAARVAAKGVGSPVHPSNRSR